MEHIQRQTYHLRVTEVLGGALTSVPFTITGDARLTTSMYLKSVKVQVLFQTAAGVFSIPSHQFSIAIGGGNLFNTFPTGSYSVPTGGSQQPGLLALTGGSDQQASIEFPDNAIQLAANAIMNITGILHTAAAAGDTYRVDAYLSFQL